MIECYYSACPNHSAHPIRPDGDYDGPFCSGNDCIAGPSEFIKFEAARAAEFRHRILTFVDGVFWYNHAGKLFLAGKIDFTDQTVTVGFHDGETYVQYVTEVNRDDVSLEMYLRQMMMIMHHFDITQLYFEGE